MAGTAVMGQPPVLLKRENLVQGTGYKDAAKEVVIEEVVTKNLVEEVKASTDLHSHHLSGNSR